MSFRILAIRPLKETSFELLKALKINCLYRFYNEYDFFNSEEQSLNGFLNSEIEDKEITSVTYNDKVPNDFYGANRSISAIVGENGSGKSSLLELYYYFTLILSDYNNIITLDKSSRELIINCEVYFQEYDDELNKISIRKIILKSSNSSIEHTVVKKLATIDLNAEYKDKKFDFKLDTESDFSVYNCVLNYSLYGLNSETIPWVEEIFYKNDGYQTPIVINPFREYGNIDINSEHLLAQARMILYVYILKQKVFLDNLYLHDFKVVIDFKKHQYLDKSGIDIFVLDVFFKFLKSVDIKYHQTDNTERILNDLFRVIDLTDTSVVDGLLEILGQSEIKEYTNWDFNNSEAEEKIKSVKYLGLLYAFKKLQKITKVYEAYGKYEFLFNEEIEKQLVWDVKMDTTLEVIYPQIKQKYLDEKITSKEDVFSEIIIILTEELVRQNQEIKEDTDFFTQYVRDNLDNLVSEAIFWTEEAFDFDSSGEWYDITLNFKNSSFFNYLIDTISHVLRPKLYAFYRYRYFKEYLKEIEEDKSHITFKLKQALSYFKIGLFDELIFSNDKARGSEVKLEIPMKFYTESKSITDIPIAFFQHDMNVVKTTEEDESEREKLVAKGELVPYSFKQLSSGEQQSIHTILNVVYHTYNLLSVKKIPKNRKYTNVSIIFDELELYLHPEYQRSFMNNILKVLEIFENEESFEYYNKNLKFSILLSTHSPFILSDIPTENILKLKKGIPFEEGDGINSFGANIHDLLADEFFLDKGSKGAFVDSIINEFMVFYHQSQLQLLKKEKDRYFQINLKLLKYEKIFMSIGDPIIKKILENNLSNLKSLISNEKV
ncbi:ATP-binding protein [Myroides guanonis]|uniref:ATPase AAA-type core domain-containing protein n=1 Tax=Myroides guanonis TaxID=1150112 RepID=A0A1I3PM93_9FLAO|nr:ATP-binding protein [Myroides guanonis]SFJ22489.1 hypothetical protein SAMN04487893_104178 [Myroides guanonis]